MSDKDNLELEPLNLVEAYNLLDIEEIKNSNKNVVFVESEVDAKLYKKFLKILNLDNIEFIGLRGKSEIPKVIKHLNEPHVYGIVDFDNGNHDDSIKELIKSRQIFQYEEMYTLENIVFNPVNLSNLLSPTIEKEIKEDYLKEKSSLGEEEKIIIFGKGDEKKIK